MKKYIFRLPTFLASTFLLLGGGLFISMNTLAEEEPVDKMSQLEAQVNELLAFKQQVQNYNPNISPFDDFKNINSEPQQLGGDGTKFPPSTYCAVDYMEWPSSDTYKKSAWAMESMYTTGQPLVRHEDVNGDGLIDYVMSANSDVQRNSCLELNNGSGWDLTYKCHAIKNNNIWTFYGDCAQQ